MMRTLPILLLLATAAAAQSEHPLPDDPRWLRFPGKSGPGAGRHVVLVAADQEYRSEQSLPMLAHLLAERHGFNTTVLFGVNAAGLVDPTQKIRWEDPEVAHDVPGLEHLASADLLILLTRLITLPAEQRTHLHEYLDSGKPLIALRTANHGFLEFDYEVGGERVRFGEDVLGGSFRNHHGRWHQDSTRGTVVAEHARHPVVTGVEDIWGPSDVYRTYPEGASLPADCTPLVMGQPLTGRQPTDAPNLELIPLPVAWVKTWTGASGRAARVFHATMGSAKDFESAGLRRLVVNAAYWGLELEADIRADSNVDVVAAYAPLASGFAYEKLGVRARPVRDHDPRNAIIGWNHRAPLYVLTTEHGAQLEASERVVDFPLLVRLNGDTFDFRQAAEGGADVRVTDASGRVLDHEIELWDAAAAQASLWVRVPEIRGDETQRLTLHWGNADATPVNDGAAVFRTGFGGVWHLGPDLADASGHGLDGENVKTEDAAGIIGRARRFGAGTAVLCGEAVEHLPSGNAPRTLSAWVQPTSFESGPTLGGWGQQGAQHLSYLTLSSLGRTKFHGYAADPEGVTRLARGAWHHVGVTLADGTIRFYLDGALEHATTIRTLDTSTPSGCYLGKHTPPPGRWARHFHGALDEVRFEDRARSAAWMKLSYENQRPLQRLVGGPLPEEGELAVDTTRAVVREGESLELSATAGGALKTRWLRVDASGERVLSVDRLRATFDSGRVSGDQDLVARFEAVYPGRVERRDVQVHVTEALPDPRVTLSAPSTWNGRDPLVLEATVGDTAAADCRFEWSLSGPATLHTSNASRLSLERAQASGALVVSVTVDNGGTPATRVATIEVTEPDRDAWLEREPAEAELPQTNQFIARRPGGTGTLHANGSVSGADRVTLEVTANGRPFAEVTAPVGSGRYRLAAQLEPGLVTYRATVRAHAGARARLLHEADGIVCGDAYVIQGQSNAEAFDMGRADHPYTSPWIRSFGSPHPNPERARSTEWGPADGFDKDGWDLQIGYWGMELAKTLVEEHGVPVFFINGAQGGTRIDQHQRSATDATDGETIYGRLLWRLRAARLTHGVRAILWHQGENDQGAGGPSGAYGWENYERYFVRLAADWKRDFPNVERYYVFQIQPKACSMGDAGSDDRLREVQRRLPERFARLGLVSTVGIQPPGGCHYPPEGYAALAHAVYPLLARDLYGVRHDAPVTPPDLQRVFHTNAARDELALEFDQEMSWDPLVAQRFALDGDPAGVVAGSAEGRVILLRFAAPVTQAQLSYVIGDRWDRKSPVLRGATGIGALTFCAVPIQGSR
ncbi:MAG: DUF2341 domain-containing protein [bacterium]|nr:DUF2341 domain-containing protein [bacterium]